MTPQDNAAPRLDEQIAYIGESIDGECGCFMCRHNRAILASLEQLQRSPSRESQPTQARESERQREALVVADSLEEAQHALARGDDATSDMIGRAIALLRLSVSGAEKADAARYRHCQLHGFPVRNQSGNDARTWIAFSPNGDTHFGATSTDAIDQAIKSEGGK